LALVDGHRVGGNEHVEFAEPVGHSLKLAVRSPPGSARACPFAASRTPILNRCDARCRKGRPRGQVSHPQCPHGGLAALLPRARRPKRVARTGSRHIRPELPLPPHHTPAAFVSKFDSN
jgi:hypothetical protein